MPTTAILFPGQGSQTAEMAEHVRAAAPELYRLAIEVVGEDPFVRAEESTRYAQPAIFCASIAGWGSLELDARDVQFMAGHSLGELAALVAAKSVSEEDGLRLVALRGALMAQSGEQAGGGGMIAVMGRGAAEQASELAAAHGLSVANDNSPQQIVLSGPLEELPRAVTAAEELGLKAMELPVSGAFHSPMMAAAVPEFEAALAETEFEPPRTTVLSAVTAEPFDDVRGRLAQALVRPVRWRETMLALHGLGAQRFIETGPGKVLTGLAKRTLKDVELVSV